MCVIIIKPEGQTIKENEIRKAFNYNNNGGGFIVRNPQTKLFFYKKGYMGVDSYLKALRPYISNTNVELVLHMRITSSGKTNKKLTHPFNPKQPKALNGKNTPIYAMNGTITDIEVSNNLNDTATFIVRYLKGLEPTKDIIELIAKVTSSKWVSVSRNGVYYDSSFIEYDGLFYSNLYHKYDIWETDNYYSSDKELTTSISDNLIIDFIGKDLYNQLSSLTIDELKQYISDFCLKGNCYCCYDCLNECKTPKHIFNVLNQAY